MRVDLHVSAGVTRSLASSLSLAFHGAFPLITHYADQRTHSAAGRAAIFPVFFSVSVNSECTNKKHSAVFSLGGKSCKVIESKNFCSKIIFI